MTVEATPPGPDGPASAEELATTVRRLNEILDSAAHLTLVTDDHDLITFASGGGRQLLSATPSSLVGRPFAEFLDPADRERVLGLAQRLRQNRGEHGRTMTVGFAALTAHVQARLLAADLTLIDRPGAAPSLVWAVRDLDSHRSGHPSVDPPMHDTLTDLPNRAMLVADLDRALARHQRCGTRLATLLVTVHGFAATWDQVGRRPAADLLLAAAGRLEVAARPGDLIARTGVDELVMVVDGITGSDEAEHLSHTLRAQLARPVDANGHLRTMDASVGIAVSDGVAVATALLHRARQDADHTRRQPAAALPPPSTSPAPSVRRRDLVSELQEAIATGQIRVAYQPVVAFDSGRVCGFEALARWDHPERGSIPPAVFITVAEQSGLIIELGRHVLVTACRQMETWRRARPEQPLRIGVNASPRQLVGQTLLDDVRQALRLSGLPPEQLIIEITESGLHRDLAGVRQLLAELRDHGVRTAMDDFGTGYSSLAYLRRLPLDILKIDRSFIADRDGAGTRFLAAIVALGLELGLDATAEGIEEPQQLRSAIDAGCTTGQGFLFARPMEVEAADLLIGSDWTIWDDESVRGLLVAAEESDVSAS